MPQYIDPAAWVGLLVGVAIYAVLTVAAVVLSYQIHGRRRK